MDNFELGSLIATSPLLKYRYGGTCAVNTMRYLPVGGFQLVNTARAEERGEHWLLLLRTTIQNHNQPLFRNLSRENEDNGNLLLFYDSFGRKLADFFPSIYSYMNNVYGLSDQILQIFPDKTFRQPLNSSMCGIYCLFVASCIFSHKTQLSTTQPRSSSPKSSKRRKQRGNVLSALPAMFLLSR